MSIEEFFATYVKDTKYKEKVFVSRVFLTEISFGSVFITTIALKHMYDRHIYKKEMLEDFNIIITSIKLILEIPDRIYLNSPEKRGDFIFSKNIDNQIYMITIEKVNENELEIVSSFATGEKYLSKFTLLRS